MDATIIQMGASLGLQVPETMVKDFNLKAGTIIELNFIQDGKFILRKKPKVREGWDAAFAQYAKDGEDRPLLPDFLDLETDVFL